MLTDAKKLLLLLLALLLAANAEVVRLAYSHAKDESEKQYRSRAEQQLEKLNASLSFNRVYEPVVQALYNKIRGQKIETAVKILKEWVPQNGLDKNDCEAALFVGKHVPAAFNAGTKNEWQILMGALDIDKNNQTADAETSKLKNEIIQFFHGGIDYEELKGRQSYICRVGRSGHRDYCVWFSDAKTNINGVNGLILLFNATAANNKKTAKKLFKSLKADTRKYGCISLFEPEDSYLPKKFDAFEIAAKINNLETKTGSEIIKIKNQELLALFKPNGKAFFKVINRRLVSIPIWSWAVLFLWLPFWCRAYISSEGQIKISLNVLLSFLFFISIALPVIGLGAYWKLFLSSHKESVKIENASRLQNYLLQIDSGFKKIYPILQNKYAKVVAIADQKLENFQKLIDETVNIEVKEQLFDTCMILDHAGRHIRPCANSSVAVRRLVFYSDAYKKAVIDNMLRLKWRAPGSEIKYVLTTNKNNFDLKAYSTFAPIGKELAYSQLGSHIGTRVMRLYNDKHAPALAAEQKKDTIKGAFAELVIADEEQDPVAMLQQGIGEFVEISYAGNSGIGFVDLLRGHNEAVYCLILFSGIYNFTRCYLDYVFSSTSKWPEDTRFFAASKSVLSINYPVIDMVFKMPKTMALMVPPKNMNVADNARINGIKNLLCSYIPQNLQTYVLSAAKPISCIDKELEPLRQKMFYGVVIILIILAFIFISLRNAVIKPSKQIMQSIRALEKRSYDYKTVIKSGDEFELLADTFNETLESMKEMEAAHFVQTCILPSAAIVGENSAFEGKTVSADDVGGDYIDAFALENGELVFFCGDVSGHSVSAALVVAMAKAAFACMIDSGIKYPNEIFVGMSTLMFAHLRRVKMMTCFGGHIDKNGLLTCSNAGQAYPFLIKDDGSIEIIKQVGYPLGATKKKSMKAAKIQLHGRCRLVMFSDGFVEAQNESGEFFGYERLEATVKELGLKMQRQDFFAAMYERLRAHCGSVPFNDDVSVAILDFDGSKTAS